MPLDNEKSQMRDSSQERWIEKLFCTNNWGWFSGLQSTAKTSMHIGALDKQNVWIQHRSSFQNLIQKPFNIRLSKYVPLKLSLRPSWLNGLPSRRTRREMWNIPRVLLKCLQEVPEATSTYTHTRFSSSTHDHHLYRLWPQFCCKKQYSQMFCP